MLSPAVDEPSFVHGSRSQHCPNPWGKTMYSLSLQRDFIASHYLVGGDWGPENDPHAHPTGSKFAFQPHNSIIMATLIDLDVLEQIIDACVDAYRDRLLNDLPEFDRSTPASSTSAAGFLSDSPRRWDPIDSTGWPFESGKTSRPGPPMRNPFSGGLSDHLRVHRHAHRRIPV
jgi:hypothetical protein